MSAAERLPAERLWMGALLRAVAKVPAGEKLNIRALREPLDLSQPDALAAMEQMIAEGRLDARTLRPPVVAAVGVRAPACRRGQSANGEPASPLFEALKAEGRRRGLTIQAVSLAVWNNKARIYHLLKRDTVRAPTAKRIRAWIAAAPPKPVAATKVATSTPARRDPTDKPDTPLMDVAERQRLNGQRHFAAVRRGQERAATEKVDAGVNPATQNSMVKAQMREVVRRRAEEERQADPVEHAKLVLRRRGRVVFDASVDGGSKGRFFVSGQNDPDTGKRLQLTEQELTALAWRVNPRGMETAGVARGVAR